MPDRYMFKHPDAGSDPAVALQRTDHKGPEFNAQETRYAGVQPALLVTGDSLGAMWAEKELSVLGLQPIVKLAVHGDLTQNMLWRLQNTAVDLSGVRLAILIAGTNNLTDGDAPEHIFRGLVALVETLRKRAPGARIAVMQPPPRTARREYNPADHQALNNLIAAGGDTHGYIAVKAPEMDPTDDTLYKDGVHMYRRAYRLLTAAVADALPKN